MKKITIVGDIMCEPLLLKAARKKDGKFDFSNVYVNVRELFAHSDYIVGNFETPLAGVEAGYVNGLFSFNAPDSFADAAKEAGIDLFLTANNHCMDRGLDGLLRTIAVLEEKGIAHTGTYRENPDSDTSYLVDLGAQKVAFLNYTYSTNYGDHHLLLSEEDEVKVNLLRPQKDRIIRAKKKTFFSRVVARLLRPLTKERQIWVKKMLHMQYTTVYADDCMDESVLIPYIGKMQEDIMNARLHADMVVFCPHVGGQFNSIPGKFTKYIFDKAIEAGVDAIIASHAHVVQQSEIKEGIPCFYSLGNFSMSPNSVYLPHENLPNYGIAAHLYIDNGEIVKVSFSILKIVESKKEMLSVYPVDILAQNISNAELKKLEKDVHKIYRTVTGKQITGDIIMNEYVIS